MKGVEFILEEPSARRVVTLAPEECDWQCSGLSPDAQGDQTIEVPAEPDHDFPAGNGELAAIEQPLMLRHAAARRAVPSPDVTDLALTIFPESSGRALMTRDGGAGTALQAPGGVAAPRPRRWPAFVLIVILCIFAVDIGLLIYSTWQTRQSISDLRQEFDARGSGPQTQELLEQIRREVRNRAQSDALQTRMELTSLIEAETARQADRLLDELKLRGLEAQEADRSNELLEKILLELQARSRTEEQSDAVSSAPETLDTAQPAAAVATEATVPPAPSPAAAPSRLDTIFFVDASGDLADQMPLFLAELRRAIDEKARDSRWTVLVYHDRELLEIEPEEFASFGSLDAAPADGSAEPRPPRLVDDVQAALADALRRRPATLYIFATHLGNLRRSQAYADKLLKSVRDHNPGGTTRIHTLQFFTRDGNDLLLQLARDNGGGYTLISPVDR